MWKEMDRQRRIEKEREGERDRKADKIATAATKTTTTTKTTSTAITLYRILLRSFFNASHRKLFQKESSTFLIFIVKFNINKH